jgi:hypothetical protein
MEQAAVTSKQTQQTLPGNSESTRPAAASTSQQSGSSFGLSLT